MKKYLVILGLFFFAGLQAMTSVKELEERFIKNISSELKQQNIRDKKTLIERKMQLGEPEYHPNAYGSDDIAFQDGSELLDQGTQSIYRDSNGNQVVFNQFGTITRIEPSKQAILSYAIKNDIVTVVQELLEQGVRPSVEDIQRAMQTPSSPISQLLMRVAYAPSQEPLFTAIEAGNIAQAYAIINKDRKNKYEVLFAVGPQGRRPLDVALLKAAQALGSQGCLNIAEKRLPEVEGRINMVLMLLDIAAARQDVTLLNNTSRSILGRCPELRKELIRRTKNQKFIQELQKPMPELMSE